ncbi:unnamed protein product [Pleuronectes platessa]|uniref:Uncharacterized protein n=1 Tax=Pleuronectes platessa TaxID=8262 RepID=A0A9N7Z049_PLEPL|nr:unnamed protein product [Pleuronectes platessa]
MSAFAPGSTDERQGHRTSFSVPERPAPRCQICDRDQLQRRERSSASPPGSIHWVSVTSPERIQDGYINCSIHRRQVRIKERTCSLRTPSGPKGSVMKNAKRYERTSSYGSPVELKAFSSGRTSKPGEAEASHSNNALLSILSNHHDQGVGTASSVQGAKQRSRSPPFCGDLAPFVHPLVLP